MADKDPSVKDLQDTVAKQSEQIEALTKENAELKAEAEKPAEVSKADAPSEDVYKAGNGKEYTGDAADAMREVDTIKANTELEKRAGEIASHLPGDINTRKALVKAVDSIPDEAERKAAQEFLKSINDERKKAFVAKGDEGDSEVASASDEFEKLVQKKVDEGMDFRAAGLEVARENPELAKQAHNR